MADDGRKTTLILLSFSNCRTIIYVSVKNILISEYRAKSTTPLSYADLYCKEWEDCALLKIFCSVN